MKSGTSVAGSQTKHTDGMHAKKPTAEQIRYAQLLNTEDSKVLTEKIRQVADVTGFSQDEVSIALHDCNFDTQAAINTLIEGRQDQSEWVMRTNKKKKHQSSVTQGIDSIIPSSSPSSQNTTVSSKPGGTRPPRAKGAGRSRQFGDQNSTAETDQKNDALVNSGNRDVTEGGRGRGTKEDKWNDRKPGGRGGPPRRSGRGWGRPGRSFQARTRDRPNRFAGGNRNDHNTTSVNGPTVNGTECWDGEDDVTKDKKTEGAGDTIPPVTEEWGTDEWNTVSESADPGTSELLFHSSVSPSHSWSDTPVASWEADTPSIIISSSSSTSSSVTAASVPTADSKHNSQDNAAHFAPESVDMAVIHSKLAQNQSMSKDQFPKVGFQIPYIPLPGELHGTANHKDSLSKLLNKVGLTTVGLSDQSSIAVQSQSQRQTRPPRAKKSQKSQIPVQAVEMPGSMNDSLDLQFGNLEFGGDSVSSPQKNEDERQSLPLVEDLKSQEQISYDIPSPPGESPHQQVNLPTPLPMSTPVTIATTTSASSTMTTLEESSSRHFQHHSPRNQKQPLISQVSKPIQHEPIALPSKLDSRESPAASKPAAAVTEQQNVPSSLQHSACIPLSSPLSGSNQPSSLRPAISTTIAKDISLESRAYHHHASQPSVQTTKDKLVPAGSLGGVQRNELSSTDGPLQPPPGVNVPHTVHQATSSNSTAFTTVTMSNTAKPLSHTTKPSLPPGVLPVNTLYGMQQGLIHAYPLPYSYEELQRLPMSPYYDLPAFQAATRDGLSTAFHADQKYGRTDTSSPVPTSLNQGATLPQAHLQQQAFINAATMPHPYGYSGLAFYPGAGMVAAGGFPAYTAPMYQMPTKTHGNASQFQSAYNSGQHSSHNFGSGYDDLGPAHDFGPKSTYHTSVSASQSKSNAGGVVSTTSDLSGAPFKPPGGKFNDSKAFLGGTPPPPPMNLPITGQHGPLGSYPHTGHPYLSIVPPVQQHHPPSHFHQHHPLVHHMEAGQPVTSQRGVQGQGPKQGQNKSHQTVGYQGSPFWSGTN